MQLTTQSSPYEVMAHSPYSHRMWEKHLTPGFKPVNPSARDFDYAIDRVAMRRHLRQFYPDYCKIIQVKELDEDQLIATIERLRGENHVGIRMGSN